MDVLGGRVSPGFIERTKMAPHRPRVALIFGGQSSEHQISCLTAAGVAKAIDTNRFEVHGVGISPSGIWRRVDLADVAALHTVGRQLPELDETLPRASLLREPGGVELVTRDGDRLLNRVRVDVALVLLHGPYGEDGTIQGQLEMLGLPYAGSGVAASAIGMDKHLMKISLEAAGLPVGPYETILPTQWQRDREKVCQRITNRLEYPVFVKPARGGSSVGIGRVAEPAGLAAAIDEAVRWDPKVVVEQGFVGAREVECAVLGPNGDDGAAAVRTSRPGEIVVHTDTAFYDFDAKYLPVEGQVELRIPAELDAETERTVQKLAVKSFLALGCEGLARVDYFITPAGEVVVNEVNTMPGFTELSMFPSLWQVSGMDYPDLITDLIEQALRRPNTVVR